MTTEDTLGVALTKRACKICGKLFDSDIVLNTKLTKQHKEEVDNLHGQCIGYLDKPCEECSESLEKAFLFIGYSEELTKDKNNPYRTGHIWGIKKEVAKEFVGEDIFKHGFTIIDIKMAEKIGLPITSDKDSK
jgi:hypothetical protein